MVIKASEIYEKVAKDNNLKPELVESVGSTILTELVNTLDDPRELAYELPKFGTFALRFKKTERFYNNFIQKLIQNDPKALKQKEDNPELFNAITNLYNKIQNYRKDKKEKKQLRNETIESSKNKSNEY